MAGKTDLAELFSAHRGITSDKITERKKSATLLRDVLDSNHIIDFITANSSGQVKGKSRSPAITWSSLFRNVVGYVFKEADAVAKLEEKASHSSSGLQSKKKDISDMLRAYIRAANKRGPHMCVGEVVDHVITVLKSGKMAVWMCSDYSWILLHYVLQKSHYVLQISAATWNELTSLYGSLLLSSHPSFDRTLLSRLFLCLISLSSSQSDLNTAAVYVFFSQAMPKIVKEKIPKVLENLLAAFVSYCTSTAHNCRGRICNLGEGFFTEVLHLWGRCQAPVGGQLITFLRVQMRVHHPCGCHDDATGGWAANDAQWKTNLEHLYELIVADFENASQKLRWSGKGETGFKPELVDLACDLIHQIMYIRNERISGHTHLPESQPRDKRLKTQTCWSTLRDGLSSNTDNPSLSVCVPMACYCISNTLGVLRQQCAWLQLIAWLLAKWPTSLSPEENISLLSQLLKLLTDSKRSDGLQWVFTCLHVLALHPSTPHTLTPHTLTSHTPHSHTTVQDLWGQVWTSTLKSVSVHSAEEEGYALLTALVEQRLVECDREPWQLLTSALVNRPRRNMALVSLLAALISNHRLPESLGSTTSPLTIPSLTSTPSPNTPSHNVHSTYPLRVQLLNFLLPASCHDNNDARGDSGGASGDGVRGGGGGEDGGIGESSEGATSISIFGSSTADIAGSGSPASLCAHLLIALTQRSCSALQHDHLKQLYLPISVRDKVQSLLGLQDNTFDVSLSAVEQLYLESTFDTPVKCQRSSVQPQKVVYTRESPIPSLLSLLLELLGKRAEQLLQPITVEMTTTARNKAHCLSVTMETQAYHCSLTVHVLFLLGAIGGRSFGESVRESLAIKLLPGLLKRVGLGLSDAVWNEMERSEYSQAVSLIVQTLSTLVSPQHLRGKMLSAECEEAMQLVRDVICASFPSDILSTCLKIALKKSSLPPRPPSATSSTFSLVSSTHSHRPSLSSSPSPSQPHSSPFDEDMDITDSDPTLPGETNQTSLTDPLSTNRATDQATCRMETAAFLVHWHQMTTTGGHSGPPPPGGEESFDSAKALMSMLSEECLQISKPADVQIAFHICQLLASCDRIAIFLESIMEVVSQVLTQHRKSQSVLCESLALLKQLARHYGRGGKEREGGGGSDGALVTSSDPSPMALSQLKTILSAFWSLYADNALASSVRLQLASTLRAYLISDPATSLRLSLKKRKKKESSPKDISIREALLCMINDPDHAVRMHMAKVVTSLHRVAGSDKLVSRDEQLKVFKEVSDMLNKAHLISTDQDDLSQEDDSVNRVASMIATLQYQACTSPACEPAVLAELATGVGQNRIDDELVIKALDQVSRFLGYPATTGFLGDHLLHMVSTWLDKGQSLTDFPHQLLGDKTSEHFFQTHADVITPLLVYRCDEASLAALSSLLPTTSLPSLLSRSLPSSMALILPSFSQHDSQDCENVSENRRSKAIASHSLLNKHLSEEEVAEIIKNSMDSFVVHLLLRLFEPATATSRLAHYSRPSDPEPPLPHFPSVAVRATLDYIASCYGTPAAALGPSTSFIKQLARRTDNVQKVLLSLAVAMETTHRPFRRRQLLQSYALFVSLVSRELGQGLEGITPFVVMDIIHTIVRVLSREAQGMEDGGRAGERSPEVGVVSLCFHVLTTLCKATLEACPEELGRHLRVVVATLVPFAQQSTADGNLSKQAMQLLNLLIVTSPPSPVLTPHISQLDPFPDRDPFQKLRERQFELREESGQLSLEQEIQRFLDAGNTHSLTTRTEGLCRLTGLICDSRSDIVELLKTGSSPILELLQALVGGVASGRLTPPTVAMEMGRCLGELGGLDLHCIALPDSSHNSSFDPSSLPNGWSPQSCYTAHILHLLSSLLRDRDISVVEASSGCLHSVLATKFGSTVLSKLEGIYDWTNLLEPFKPQKKKAPQPGAFPNGSTPSGFASIDTPNLWIPRGSHSNTNEISVHESWIITLVTSLLDSGGVLDPVLVLVKPVCQVKVSFCESVFPYLILSILWDQEEHWQSMVLQHFRHFFSIAANSSPPYSPSPSPTSSMASSTRLPSSPLLLLPPASIRIFLNTIMFLRTINRPKLKKSTLWDNNFWLDLDFLDVAMAAQRCSAYFTSLLYTEIWHGAKCDKHVNNDSPEGLADDDEAITMDTTTGLTGLSSLEEPSVQQLLLEVYSDIGEPDSLYGVCAGKSVMKGTWMRLYEHEGDWEKSLSAFNLQMHLPSAGCQANLVKSLQSLGLTHVLNMYLTGVGAASPQSMQGLSRFQYEAAWRCAVWEDQNSSTLALPGSYTGYHRHLCDSLLAIRDGEEALLASSLSSARSELLGSLCSGGLEGSSRVYRCLSQLLCLCELEEAGGGAATSGSNTDLHFLTSWRERLKHLDADFSYLEPVLSLRASTLHSLMLRERSVASGQGRRRMGEEEEGEGVAGPLSSVNLAGRQRVEQLFGSLSETLLTLAKKAQEAGRYQVAEGALFSLHHLHNSRSSHAVPEALYPSLPWKHQLQEAKLHWGRGESSPALGQLRSLLQRMKTLSDPPLEVSSLYPSALCLYGSWLAHTHSENPGTIMKSYFEQSVSLMEKQHSSDPGPILHAYLMLARYADSQYQRVTRHMTSTAYKAKKQLLQTSKLELDKLMKTVSAESRGRNRHIQTLKAQIEEDQVAMTGLIEDKKQFLEKALHNYIHCLRTGDEHDLRVFRLCALWFANASDAQVNTIIKEGSAQLESRKFLPLMYQLAARMSARTLATDPFQHTLQEIIFRTSVDHPYHSLYVTLALSHASMDDRLPSAGHVTGAKLSRPVGRMVKKNSTGTGSTVDEDKVKAARDLIHRLHSEKPSLVQSMEWLCEAYIDLAYHDVSAHRKERKPIKFPASCTLIKLASQLKEVAVPTMEIEIDPTCVYNGLVTIDRFDPHFQLAGGINLPKVLSCMGSDGKRRRQLVKGKDDLRQDAVMQQVFILVNRLLQKEHTSSKRNLSIRTYKVIPLSQRSGIVEWCEGTTPLGEYLIGPQKNPFQGAHYRYRPQDWTSMDCRRRLTEAGTKRGSSKFEVYSKISRHFRPVFHHFFMERFASPSQWFERRLAYTRSVATSSIVGYVVGLGDRHVQNILIDTNTAEFIHIDLGVAFEQGKTLPSPETVPFRLTRDVVDGMGVAGVEGVFRRCCEKTMEVMRASHEELRTIVEVLLHDPLYMWTISPVKALNLQRRPDGDDSSTTGAVGDQIFEGGPAAAAAGGGVTGRNGSNPTNKMAERVLLRLQEKLEGIEDGVPLSVSGQVNQLIQEATDPSNLCLLFPGWQPWI